ncbi:hypothetical protein BTW14_gp190 [BeAn 58058 virus]|uniref:hypothetical protein n=1 Tax=BeAn 58058 virus TaxID=67082 RepID=UPI00090A25A8|nr:hypothetical protein BTW14_gp190 [BeAn 58058 virus]APG58381.1 hypothetical protein BAV00208 [BeAn 58058 virus]
MDIFRELTIENNNNIIFSPSSFISIILLRHGVASYTSKQILNYIINNSNNDMDIDGYNCAELIYVNKI